MSCHPWQNVVEITSVDKDLEAAHMHVSPRVGDVT